ncbi:MAG: LLM class F420-dependent oxidoreductase, partial [Acidimicrobiales bacterium]
RAPEAIGAEASVPVVGDGAAGWPALVEEWRGTGLTHLCLRTLRADLTADQHLAALADAASELGLLAK